MNKFKIMIAGLLVGLTSVAGAEVILRLDGEPYGMLTAVAYQPLDKTVVIKTLDDWACASETGGELGGERDFKLELDTKSYSVDSTLDISLIPPFGGLQELVVNSLADDLLCVPAGTPVYSDAFN